MINDKLYDNFYVIYYMREVKISNENIYDFLFIIEHNKNYKIALQI